MVRIVRAALMMHLFSVCLGGVLLGRHPGSGTATGGDAGETSRHEGRTSAMVNPTLGLQCQSIRVTQARTAQTQHTPRSWSRGSVW
jgi:hypothetical protein